VTHALSILFAGMDGDSNTMVLEVVMGCHWDSFDHLWVQGVAGTLRLDECTGCNKAS
jgi:hypothetical protein